VSHHWRNFDGCYGWAFWVRCANLICNGSNPREREPEVNHKENRVFKFVLSIVCLLVVTLGQASAGPIITVPTSLSPGDSYRLAFLTTQSHDALSANINVYNTFVDGLGDLVIASDWRAIASTPTMDARDNTGTNPNLSVGVPIFDLNDTLVAIDNADLWDGDILHQVEYSDDGTTYGTLVWTGTQVDGTGNGGRLGTGGGSGAVGVSLWSNGDWIDWDTTALDESKPFYALSGEFVVLGAVVPEPSSLMLLGIGAVGLLGYRLRRNRKLSPTSS